MVGQRRDREVETLLAHVVRLALQDGWTAQGAAGNLRVRTVRTDDAVLQRARRRVAAALLERPTPIGERAAATLDAARAQQSGWEEARAVHDPVRHRPRPPVPAQAAP